MKKNISGLTALLLLATPIAAYGEKPIYRTAVPESMCAHAKDFYKKVDTCQNNGAFVKFAQECWNKLEDLQKKVTHDLDSRIGTPKAGRQNESFGVSGATYEEGIAAHEYMFHATQLAQSELDDYFDYMIYPEEARSDKDVFAEACYMDNAVALDDLAEKFQEKLVAIVSKLESAELLKNEDATNKTQAGAIDPASPGAAKGGKLGASLPNTAASKASGKKPVGNTITGVEEDKKKQLQAPKK